MQIQFNIRRGASTVNRIVLGATATQLNSANSVGGLELTETSTTQGEARLRTARSTTGAWHNRVNCTATNITFNRSTDSGAELFLQSTSTGIDVPLGQIQTAGAVSVHSMRRGQSTRGAGTGWGADVTVTHGVPGATQANLRVVDGAGPTSGTGWGQMNSIVAINAATTFMNNVHRGTNHATHLSWIAYR